MLAVEKARRLATEGFRTLLTCYNRQLANHLQAVCQGTPELDVMSFHQLCHRLVEKAKHTNGIDAIADAQRDYPDQDYFDVHLPNALSSSLIQLPDRYDAVVCDEGQDFRADYWVSIEFILSDPANSPLYIFYDDNQNLYARARCFPIADDPFSLTANCRNTDKIHDAAYRYYCGIPVEPPANVGEEIILIEALHREQQAKRLHARVVDLIANQSVAPDQIVILIAASEHKRDYYSELCHLPLPRPVQWIEEAPQADGAVLLETVKRFKGLESPIVFLWGLDELDWCDLKELLYVGMSRAKSMLYVVGNARTVASVLAP